MNFSNYKFRCSSLGKLMVEPRSKSEVLSETTKSYLRQLHREEKYNRRKEFSNKFIEKGLQCEEDGITLFSRVRKTFFKKNSIRLTNSYITGEPDLYTGLEITNADEGFDIKASWSLFTFPYPGDKLNTDYYWQNIGYMILTSARKWTTVYTLVNTPETLILDEKRKLFYKMNAGTEENKDYQEACEELERSMVFDDIPMQERVIEFHVERSDEDIEKLYKRVDQCRLFLNELEGRLNPFLLASADAEVKATIIEQVNAA